VSSAVEVDELVVVDPRGRRVLDRAALRVAAGEVVAVVGPSGSGKTTLLRALTGGLPVGLTRSAGDVRVLGHRLLDVPAPECRRLRRRHLGFVGQDPGSRLNPRMRVRQLLAEVAADRGRDALCRVLADVRLAEELLSRRPGELSGGQQRRVAVARALARRPDVLLLDEPTAGLDVALRDEMAQLLRGLAARHGLAVAVCCHDPELVELLADRVVELPHAAGSPTGTTVPAWHAVPAAPAPGPALLTARGVSAWVTRRGARVPILDGVDLDVGRGAAVAVVGESGAGKTTLARALAGLHPYTAGEITLGGTVLRPGVRRRTRDQRRRVQLVPQDPLGALNPRRTVGEAVARPLLLHGLAVRAAVPGRVEELLQQVGLPAEYARRFPHELSGGQRQRVSVARALAAQPDVLLCDEVTSALDPATAEAIMTLLGDTRRACGLALVVISHDPALVARHTDQVVVLDAGSVVPGAPWTNAPGPGRRCADRPAPAITMRTATNLPVHFGAGREHWRVL
jgi:peptide/nickel transport system ATP-binding protein